MIDASQTIDELHKVVREVALEVIEKANGQDICQLWTSSGQGETEVDGVPRKKRCHGRGEGRELSEGVNVPSTPFCEDNEAL